MARMDRLEPRAALVAFVLAMCAYIFLYAGLNEAKAATAGLRAKYLLSEGRLQSTANLGDQTTKTLAKINTELNLDIRKLVDSSQHSTDEIRLLKSELKESAEHHASEVSRVDTTVRSANLVTSTMEAKLNLLVQENEDLSQSLRVGLDQLNVSHASLTSAMLDLAPAAHLNRLQEKITELEQAELVRATKPLGPEKKAPGIMPAPTSHMWMQQPAEAFFETMPIGNGRLGALVRGGVCVDVMSLSEETIHTASRTNDGKPSHFDRVKAARQQLKEGKVADAQRQGLVSGGNEGAFQYLADITFTYASMDNIESPSSPEDGTHSSFCSRPRWGQKAPVPPQYLRQLDMQAGVTTTVFQINGVTHTRTAFASTVDDVVVMMMSCDTPGCLRVDVGIHRQGMPMPGASLWQRDRSNTEGKAWKTAAVPGGGVSLQGVVGDLSLYTELVMHSDFAGGKKATGHAGGSIKLEHIEAAVLIIAAGTNFKDTIRGQDPQQAAAEEAAGVPDARSSVSAVVHEVKATLAKASAFTGEKLLQRHTDEFRKRMDRVKLSVSSPDREPYNAGRHLTVPIDKRLAEFQAGITNDTTLMEPLFQYGRYLLASSAGKGTLPPNLQGIWHDGLWCPWNADMHTNINLQMAYWPAEVGKLPESVEPLAAYIRRLITNGRNAARNYYNASGFTTHGFTDMWAHGAPLGEVMWGDCPTCGAWLVLSLHEHYLFSHNTGFLKGTSLPALRASVQFLLDYATVNDYGEQSGNRCPYLFGPSISPENSYGVPQEPGSDRMVGHWMTMHASFDVAVTTAVLDAFVKSVRTLQGETGFKDEVGDRALTEKASAMLSALSTCSQVGASGELQEWLDGSQQIDPGHRHWSHLFGLFPGQNIHPQLNPMLSAAAAKAIALRDNNQGGHTGWSRAWMIMLQARLGQGGAAGRSIQTFVRKYVTGNLMSLHPPTAPPHFSVPGCATCVREVTGGPSDPSVLSNTVWQMDGNTGIVAGVAEMLLQSHVALKPIHDNGNYGYLIQLLPALPEEWTDGRVEGLGARGDVTVFMKWSGSKLKRAVLQFGVNARAVTYGVQYIPCALQVEPLLSSGGGVGVSIGVPLSVSDVQPVDGLNPSIGQGATLSENSFKLTGVVPGLRVTLRTVCQV